MDIEWLVSTLAGIFMGLATLWFVIKPLTDKWFDGEQ